ncbi:adenine phosphoribosyltransferase [Palaemon carinicauda]|uniref:adenine phosphoribosyltransferase n=1 Tax=Palaemon carinicauda TaxID=392227 RepID=UPI0035B662A3
MSDERVEIIKEKIGTYPDFPKPGILFRDIFSVLSDPPSFEILIKLMEERIRKLCPEFDVILGLESRGFVLGAPLALALNKPFVPMRKKGKLPGKLKQVTYTLEYGTDVFEVQENSIKKGQTVVIVDDLLATGGTMKAACDLVSSLSGKVALCLVVIELNELKGRDKVKAPLEVIVKY